MQLAKCLVLVVASVLAGASTSDGASLQLRSQHSLESSLRSKPEILWSERLAPLRERGLV
jgi:hypothetical protein